MGVSQKGHSTQARQVRAGDGAGNRRLRSLREALSRVAQGFQGQEMSQVRQEASGRSRQRKEKARGDASSPPGPEEGRQAVIFVLSLIAFRRVILCCRFIVLNL